jgi:chromosome segregation ATPase
MNETTRLHTRGGIKMIDYEVHMKLQKHCEELEALVKHHHDKFKEACQHIRDQAQEHREKLQGYMDMCYDHNARIFDLELELKEAVADCQAEFYEKVETQRELKSCNEALENVKSRRDEYYQELSQIKEKYQILRDALKTIKYTDCDTYKVAGKALLLTKEDDENIHHCKWHDDRPAGSCDCLANSGTGEEL